MKEINYSNENPGKDRKNERKLEIKREKENNTSLNSLTSFRKKIKQKQTF